MLEIPMRSLERVNYPAASRMKRIAVLLVAVPILASAVAFQAAGSRPGDQQAAPIFVTKIPSGYRDWKLISVAREGIPKNGVQFMVKDSKKYASTGGWGFAHFDDEKPAEESMLKSCFPCHQAIKARDLVFTQYAR